MHRSKEGFEETYAEMGLGENGHDVVRAAGPGVETPGLRGRVRLGERITEGVDPPNMLVEGELYEGKIHALNSEPGEGKTIKALACALDVVGQGRNVLFLDAENGPNLVAERLEDMGANPADLDRHFFYYSAPEIALDPDSLADLDATIAEVQPALVVFDSLPDFLALAGLNENDAGDVTRWIVKCAQRLRDEQGCAVLLLDHVAKATDARGRYARGSGAKLAKVDVSWTLVQTVPFDRERVGEVELRLRKDRLAYMPQRRKFATGGAGNHLICKPTDGLIEDTGTDGLTNNARLALEVLETRYSETGARFNEWLAATSLPKQSFNRSRKLLEDKNLCRKVGGRYWPNENPKPPVEVPRANGTGFGTKPRYHGDEGDSPETPQNTCKSQVPLGNGTYSGTCGTGPKVPPVPPPYKGGTDGTGPGPTVEAAKEAMRHGNGPRKVYENVCEGTQKLPDLARSIAYYRGRGFDGWETWLEATAEAFEALYAEAEEVQAEEVASF